MSAFDEHRPPDPARLAECVHCGFCLPTCPTYLLWGEEMDSPRGRIQLLDLVSTGQAPLDDTVAGHIDACLGCLACVSACPSGVRYDQLLEAARPQIERNVPRRRADRLFRAVIFALFPHPARLRVVALGGVLYHRLRLATLLRRSGLHARLPARLRALEGLLPPVRLHDVLARPPRATTPVHPPRRRVAVLTGCVQRVFFGAVNAATVRVLAAEGCAVSVPPQGCCGALSLHSGREVEAAAYARRLIDALDPTDVDAIVVNVAGCGSSMKGYGELLADDPAYAQRAAALAAKVRDVTEVLAELEPQAPRHPIPGRVAYHDACHLGHAQGVRQRPRQVLGSIPHLQVVDVAEAEICCGSAGVYNLLQPQAAEQLGQRKAEALRAAAPDAIATGNPGCLLQIRRHLGDPTPLFHPVELLDASIRGERPFGQRSPDEP